MKAKVLVFFILLSLSAIGQLSWTNYNTSNSPLPNNVGYALTVDKLGNIWLASGDFPFYGLQKFDGTNWSTYNTYNSSLPTNDIRALVVDTNNILFAGTYDKGLVRFDGSNWTLFDTTNSNIISDYIGNLMVDRLNRVWIGCPHYGVSILDTSHFTNLTSSNSGMPSSMCVAQMIMDDSLDTWFAMNCAQGVARLNHTDSTWFYLSGTPSGYISSIAMDQLNRLWIAYSMGYAGFSRYDSTGITNYHFVNSFSWTYYESLRVDASNHVWIGTRGETLYDFDGTNWINYGSPMPTNGVTCNLFIDQFNRVIYREQFSGLWIAQLPNKIDEHQKNNLGVIIYPNPVSDRLNIKINQPGKTKIEIWDILGEVIFSQVVSEPQTTVDIKNIASGIYFLSVQASNGVVTKMFIKN